MTFTPLINVLMCCAEVLKRKYLGSGDASWKDQKESHSLVARTVTNIEMGLVWGPIMPFI